MRWFSKAFLVKLIVAIALFGFSFYSFGVEVYYSQGIYPFIAQTLRYITKYIPFSLGDVLYIFLGIYLLYRLFNGVVKWRQSSLSKKQKLVKVLQSAASFGLTIYICFKLIWGLNYNRLGVIHQLKIKHNDYCKEDVAQLLYTVIAKANYYRLRLDSNSLKTIDIQDIYAQTQQAYHHLSSKYSFLAYQNHSIKNSTFSKWGKYFGFTGYYNPFSGEAQLRYDAPKILLPVVACHEVAHQLGYANEMEANFIGFLVAANAKHTLFNYSAYVDLILYAQGELANKYLEDDDVQGLIAKSRELKDCLHPLVKRDIKEIRDFFNREQTAVSNLSNSIYNQYLMVNSQKKGIKSYNEVIGLVLSYYAID